MHVPWFKVQFKPQLNQHQIIKSSTSKQIFAFEKAMQSQPSDNPFKGSESNSADQSLEQRVFYVNSSSDSFQNMEISASRSLDANSLRSSVQSQLESSQEEQQEEQSQKDRTHQQSPMELSTSDPQQQTKNSSDSGAAHESSERKQEESEVKQVKDSAVKPAITVNVFEEKLNQAIECKNRGNDFFKKGQLENSIKAYSEGLNILNPNQFYGATQAECNKLAEVSGVLLCNIGSCYFNLQNWRTAAVYFSESITINPKYVKALYKRALCRYEMQDYEGSMTDIKEAFSLDKANGEIYNSYQKIIVKYNEQIKKDKENLKQMSSKIFRSESQKSLNASQKSINSRDEAEKGEKTDVKQRDEGASDFWGIAPLVLVAGAALFIGYKKWTGK